MEIRVFRCFWEIAREGLPAGRKIRSQGRRYSPPSRFGSEQPDEKGFLLKGVSCILVYEKQPEGGAL